MSLLDQTLGPLEIALNRALGASPGALDKLQSLGSARNQMLSLYFRDLGWGFRLVPAAHGVQLLPGIEDARAAVSTSLVGLARLMAGEDPREMGQALLLEGDAEYAQQIMGAIRSARFDLEAELTSLLGPLLNSGLGQSVRSVLDFGRDSLKTLLTGNLAQSSDEAAVDQQLAGAESLRAWMDAVDDAATGLDRIEARLARLEQSRGDA